MSIRKGLPSPFCIIFSPDGVTKYAEVEVFDVEREGAGVREGEEIFAMGYKQSVRCLSRSIFLGSSICENSLGTGSRYG